MRESYIRKYQDRRPDLIIALGPSPLQFMVDAHEKFFAGIPIVFGGTSEPQANNPTLDPHFTGCWETFEPEKTLDLALRLQPGSRHVVVVGGMLSYDLHLEAIYRERLHGYEPGLEFTYLTDLDMPSLLERLKRLPDHTIVLYSHIGMDAKGTKYISASQAGPMVASVANAPVFGPSDVDLGHGQVGGYLQSFAKEGKIVGGIAVRILNGERPQDVAIVRGANAYIFDWRALQRWGFNERDLPAGSDVLFRSPSFWQRTKWIWTSLLLIAISLSLLAWYIRSSRKQLKVAKDRQLSLSGMLITAQEKERSRLASEIHDDFSQRLALLALGLENAEEAIGTSPGEAVRQVHSLLNSASEIGADLHTLSHHLHSSTLEALGLVPGVSALCKEFAVQQGIEIDFLPEDIPHSVHPDVALCLFRIVQEGLRNYRNTAAPPRRRYVCAGPAPDSLFLCATKAWDLTPGNCGKRRASASEAWKSALTCWAGDSRLIRNLARGQRSKPGFLSNRNQNWQQDELASNALRIERKDAAPNPLPPRDFPSSKTPHADLRIVPSFEAAPLGSCAMTTGIPPL